MERQRRVKAIGGVMVALGLVQAGWGIRVDDLVFAALGAAYACLGVGFYFAEG